MAIDLDMSSLLALVLESILFGLLTALFATTVYILIFRKGDSRTMNNPVLAVAVLMYCVALVHVSLSTRRAVIAFVLLSGSSETADAYFAASNDPTYIAKITMIMVQTLVGDSFIIYRMYMVWGRDVRLLIPALVSLLGCTASAIITLIDVSHISPTTVIFVPQIGKSLVSFFALTLFTNLSCTLLIAFKIWWTGRQLGSVARSQSLSPVMNIVIESGGVYSATLIALMAAYLSRSWGHYIVSDMVVQVIAITFSLIIVCIGMGISASNHTQHFHSSLHARSGVIGTRSAQESMPMQPLVVHLATTRTVKDDSGRAVSEGYEDSVKTDAMPPDSKRIEDASFVDV